jgi:membrane protease YdiL (CAAX protease family)
MTWLDLAVSALILVWPIWEHRVGLPRLRARLAAGDPDALRRAYRGTMALQWALTLLALMVWIGQRRSLEVLGLRLPTGWGAVIGIALIAGLILLLVRQEKAIRADPAIRARVYPQLRPVAWFLPRTRAERDAFMGLSVTAGICEELLCRGWFLGLLAPWVHPAITLAATSIFFGLGHAYQGLTGILKTGLTGLAMGAVYLITGSLFVPMILHAAIDIGSGRVAWLLLKDEPTATPASPESAPAG